MRTIGIAIAAAWTLASAPALAQDADMALRLSAGAHYTVTVDQTQTNHMAGQASEVSTSTVTALDIVEAGEGGLWRYTPVSLTINSASGPGFGELAGGAETGLAAEAISALMRLVGDVGFDCRVDAVGRCVELANWQLWRNRAENLTLAIDALAQLGAQMEDQRAAAPAAPAPSGKGGAPQANAEAKIEIHSSREWLRYRAPVMQAMAGVIDGVDARSAATMMGAFHPPAAVQGRRLRRGESVSFVEDWPMPFAAPPMRMSGAIRLERVNARAGTATVTRTARLDSAGAQTSLRGMTNYLMTTFVEPFAPLMRQSGQAAPSPEMTRAAVEGMLSVMRLEVEETTRGEIDLSTGLARETVTDLRIRLITPSNGKDETVFDTTQRSTVRIVAGAPAAPRLPRSTGT